MRISERICRRGRKYMRTRKKLRRWLSTALALLLLLTLLPGGVRAAGTVASGNCGAEGSSLTWTLDSDGVLTISGTGAMADFDYGGAPWYENRESVKTVVLKSGVTSIGRVAFQNCSNLAGVTIPTSVTSLGDHAFMGCIALTGVTIPSGIKTLGREPFLLCSSLKTISVADGNPSFSAVDGVLFNKNKTELITYPGGKAGSYNVPSGVISIGTCAFFGSGVTEVTVSSSVTSIGGQAFYLCNSLMNINVQSDNPSFCSDDGILFNLGKQELIACPPGKTGCYVIPNSVYSIGDCAFMGCRLSEVKIPNSVNSIGNSAFSGCSRLTSVIIPDVMGTIANSAFSYCSALTSVTIPYCMNLINAYAFDGCSRLTDVYYGGTAKAWAGIYIEDGNDPLLNATLHPESITGPDIDMAENPRGASSASIPEGVYKLSPACAPGSCLDTTEGMDDTGNIVINTASSRRSQLFYIRNLGNGYYSLDSGNTGWLLDMLGGVMYAGTNVQVWYNNYTLAQQWAIYDLGNGYYSIAPRGNTELSMEVYGGGSADWTNVQAEEENGTNAQRWKLTPAETPFAYTVDDNGNATITGYAGNNGVVTIPAKLDGHPVTRIGEDAFRQMDRLTSVTIPNGVTSIGSTAFCFCSNLKSVSLPESLYDIGHYAFFECISLSGITLPKNVTSIGVGVFTGCQELTAINVDAANQMLTSVDGVLFDKAMTTLIAYPAKKAGNSYSIPDGILKLNNFSLCRSGLRSVTIPASVATIAYASFDGCESLTDVYYPGTQADWDAITIEERNTPLTDANLHFTMPLVVTGVTANKSTAKPGDTITWTANVTGGASVQYCFYIFKNGKILERGAYGTAKTYSYTANDPGTYTARVYAKDGSGTTLSADSTGTVVANTLVLNGVTANKTEAKPGETITWTASATGGASVQFCFYIFKDGKILERGAYGTTRTCSYTANEPGTYTVRVYAKDGSGAALSADSTGTVVASPLTLTSIKADKASAKPGDTITWTVSSTGGSAVKYCFYVFKDGKVVERGAYGTAKTCSYTANEPGTYTARVYAREGSNTTPLQLNSSSTVVSSPLALTNIKADKATADPGDTITWTVSSTGGSAEKYCFYVFKDGKVVDRGAYGTAKSYSYRADAAGTYTARVYAKEGSNPTPLQLNSSSTVVSSALVLNSIRADKAYAAPGDTITWTVSTSGGSAVRYCFYIFKDGKILVRGDYGTTKTCSYTANEPGNYTARVYAKDGAAEALQLTSAGTTVSSPLMLKSVKPDKSTAAPGDTITWTVSSTGGSAVKYCFYVFKDGKVVDRGAYGTAKTYSYTPDAAGTYTVRVYGKDGSADPLQLNGGSVTVAAAGPLTITAVTSSVSSTDAGEYVIWTATADGGNGSFQYCFYLFQNGHIIHRGSYGSENTYIYLPDSAGTWSVRVYVKDSTGTVATKDNAAPVTVS